MGLAATAISETTTGIFQRLSLYYLSAPTNGSQTFSLDYDDASTDQANLSYVVAAWFDGAHQTQGSVLDLGDDDTGSTDPSLSIVASENNEVVVAMYASEADAVLTATKTAIQSQDHGTRTMGTQYEIQTTATTSTMSWTGTDANYVVIGAAFKEAAGGGGTEYDQSVGGTLTLAGTVTKATTKTFAGTLTSAGTVVKSTAKTLAGTLTTAGAVTKSTGKLLAGTLTSSGAITSSFTFLKSLEGTLTMSGALVKDVGKNVAGTLTPTGAISKAIAKSLAGTLSFIGGLVAALVSTAVQLLDVELSDSAVYTVELSDSAVYAVSLSDSVIYTVTLSDESRS
jgi:hypothetical protein